jgi:hypothetical protein
MTRCTCTVFARNIKLHSPDCAKRKAYEQQQQQQPITSSERKAGKKERIAKMVENLFPKQEPVFDAQLMGLLGMKKDTK